MSEQPLKNPRWEIYAQARAKGLGQAEAWQRTVPFGQQYSGSNTSLRVSGHRVEQRPEVQARIQHLTKHARRSVSEGAQVMSRADIVRVSLEVSEALEAAYKAAQSSSASPQAIERLKTVWASHLSRQGQMQDASKPLPDAEHSPDFLALQARIQNFGDCKCQTR